ncbi:MAG: hypothetical protein VX246_04685 [Myxococcota bacterium]|nr:hypothetical protein [Myxococcota bacterium]
MTLRHLIVAAALVAVATPALATVKVYSADPDNGQSGTVIQYATGLCPPVDPSPGQLQGRIIVTDTGGGSPVLTEHGTVSVTELTYDTGALTGIFGPGSFVFVNTRSTWTTTATPPPGSGTTAPGGSLTWGLISGWASTGLYFCIASPQTICTGGAMVPHGSTTPAPDPDSPTYDLGTWSFDAEGDLTGSQYIAATFNGGTANRQRILTGAYVGASVPALPLIGAAALALGLAVAGTRSVMRKK